MCGTGMLKFCLGLISLFFWICAIVLIVIGALILGEYANVYELAKSTEILIPSSILIGAGVFLFIVGILGCVGGMRGNKAALFLFFVLSLIILVGEVVAVALSYEYGDQAHAKLTANLHHMVDDCAGNRTVEDKTTKCNELDFLQSKFRCCGADSYRDWFNESYTNNSIPTSCCRQKDCHPPPRYSNESLFDEVIYTVGCSDKAVNTVKKYFTWIFIATVVGVVLQVLGLVATCVMLFRSQETPYLSLDSQGYRV